jgi:hypothetical protein
MALKRKHNSDQEIMMQAVRDSAVGLKNKISEIQRWYGENMTKEIIEYLQE